MLLWYSRPPQYRPSVDRLPPNTAAHFQFPNTVFPPNTAVHGTAEKPAVFRNGGIGREYKLKKPYLGLEMGGGIGREAVLGGTVLGGTTVGFL